MIYLICQDWANTSNNHAGIKYLCNAIQTRKPSLFKTFTIPYFLDETKLSSNRIIRKIQVLLAKCRHKKYVQSFTGIFLHNVNTKDIVVVMEYMEIFYPILPFVKAIKNKNSNIKVYGMVHLVPSKLDIAFPNDESFNKWTSQVDKILTLGSSLTNYFIERGIQKEKILTTFHYVDNSYYKRQLTIKSHNLRLKVIAMGNQMRNVTLLKSIVNHSPDVDFIICQGINNLESHFKNCANVQLIPFVSENELRDLMTLSDVSLNVMYDTIGSNVIVTSMAMGLAMICSDVGSIRDYCSDKNCIFCDNEIVDQFTLAISTLSKDRGLLKKMQENSVLISDKLSIDRFIEVLKNI